MRRLLFVGLLVGCASAGTGEQQSGVDGSTDSTPIDAAIDAPAPCVEVMTELLVNGNLDGTPLGTGWMQMSGGGFELITPDGGTAAGGIAEQSAPNDIWLGGVVNITDTVFQDVVIPARTRLVNLSGFYEIRTGETVATPHDTGAIEWVTPAGAPIATILAMDDTKKTTTWTTLNYGLTDAQMYSGMTIRLRLTATNNASAPTSFFIDTLSVKATHCMP